MTIFFASGTLRNGQFAQEGNGQFGRYNLITPAPDPTSTPGPSPTPEPTDTPETYTVYSGTYRLSDGEQGQFGLLDATDVDSASGFPTISGNKTPDFLHPVTRGTANISVSVSGSTGSGSVRLSNGFTGSITITNRQVISASAAKQMRSKNALIKR